MTNRVSVASDGTQGNNPSSNPYISANARYVVFDSYASNLVSGDTNGVLDIFVHDRQTKVTSRTSVSSNGTQGNEASWKPYLSADGRYVTFTSLATNLVSGDTNGWADVFVHDRQTGETIRISVATNGTQGNGDSGYSSISADGRYVAFSSVADNLVSGDTNYSHDVFVYDRQTRQTRLVSIASDGTQGNSGSGQYAASTLSADGRFVAFSSYASNLISNDTNGAYDVFVHDRQTGQTNRVSIASDGAQGNSWSGHSSISTISADGRFVVFDSYASNLDSDDTNEWGDVFIHDLQTNQTSLVSVASDGTQGLGGSGGSSISADGNIVAFSSSNDLVSGDTNYSNDVFVHDRRTGETSLVSIASDGTQGNSGSWRPSLSADGRYVVFISGASNLVSDDTNGGDDVFVHDRGE